MVQYWNFLYRPKQPNESQLDALSRRLAFKLPIVLRYSVGFSLLFGILHAILARNAVWVKRYCYLVPFGMVGLCYEDIFTYLRIQKVLPPLKPKIQVNKNQNVNGPISVQDKEAEKYKRKPGEKIQKIVI